MTKLVPKTAELMIAVSEPLSVANATRTTKPIMLSKSPKP